MVSFSPKTMQKQPFSGEKKKISKIQKIDFFSKCFKVNYMIVDGLQSVLKHPGHVLEAL